VVSSTNSTTVKSCLVTGTNAASGTSITWALTLDLAGSEPGAVFLRTGTQVSAYRAVAACAEVMTLDTELNRQGIVACGTVSNGALYGLDSSVDQLSTLCNVATRTPSEKLEVVWQPGEAAAMFVDPTEAVAAQQVDRHNGILLAWSGFGAATAGMRVKLTLVVEWKPRRGTGLTSPGYAVQSRSSFAELVRYMADNSEKFIRIGGRIVNLLSYTGRRRTGLSEHAIGL